MYIDAVYLGRGENSRDALCDLLDMDCCEVIPYDLHSSQSNDCIFIGCTRYQPLTAKDRSIKSYAVKDIRIITEMQPNLVVSLDGKSYKRAIDKYSYNQDYTQAIALNEKDSAYLYYSTDGLYSPIDKIGIGECDRVPPTENDVQVWENVLTEHNIRYNLNNSLITFKESDDDIVCDNRLYLFVRRLDGSVKFGSEIVGGHCEEAIQYGTLNYKKG